MTEMQDQDKVSIDSSKESKPSTDATSTPPPYEPWMHDWLRQQAKEGGLPFVDMPENPIPPEGLSDTTTVHFVFRKK